MLESTRDRLSRPFRSNSPSTDSDGQSSDSQDEASRGKKYLLKVTAGSSYDPSTHIPVQVNGDNAVTVENEFMTAKIKVRVKDYDGLPRGSKPTSPYFSDPIHTSDRYSIGFSFVPKQNLPAENVVWGNDFDHPVRDRLPPGFNTAFKIVKDFIDPGLSCDAYADQPWLYGPALSCWLAFRIGDKTTAAEDFPQVDEEHVLKDGGDGSGAEIRQKLGIPDNGQKRRKHFLDRAHRAEFEFEKDRLYYGDFYNPYLDFNKFALRLPGFSLSVIRYINDKTHNLRYVFKNLETGDVYFVVVFTLLFGQELRDAVEAENGSNGASHTGASSSSISSQRSLD